MPEVSSEPTLSETRRINTTMILILMVLAPNLPPEFSSFNSWPEAWGARYKQSIQVATLCRAPIKSYLPEPHGQKWSMVRGNNLARPSLAKDGSRTFPVGAVLVKEKFDSESGGKPTLLTAMVKRKPGFNPKVGDWEFFSVELGKKIVVSRGTMDSCIGCHQNVAQNGFVFTISGKSPRVWLP